MFSLLCPDLVLINLMCRLMTDSWIVAGGFVLWVLIKLRKFKLICLQANLLGHGLNVTQIGSDPLLQTDIY